MPISQPENKLGSMSQVLVGRVSSLESIGRFVVTPIKAALVAITANTLDFLANKLLPCQLVLIRSAGFVQTTRSTGANRSLRNLCRRYVELLLPVMR